jgi:hypothetical protein
MGKILSAIKEKGRLAGITIATALAMMYNVNTANSQYLKVLNLKDNIPVAGIRDSVVLYDNYGIPILKAVKESDANGIAEFTDTDWKSTSVRTIDNNIPSEISVSNSWPSIISGDQETNTNVSSPRRAKITQKLFNILGQEIITYTLENDGSIEPSTVSISAKMPPLATSMYFLRTTIKTDKEEKVQTNKIVIRNDGSTMTFIGNTTMAANMSELVAYTPVAQSTTQTPNKTTGNLEARIFSTGDHYYQSKDSTIILLTGEYTEATINGESGNSQEIKIINSINYLTADSLVNDAKFILDDGRIRYSKNGKILYVSKKQSETISNAIIEHQDFYRQKQYFIVPDKDSSQALLILQKNPKQGLENITDAQMVFMKGVLADTLTWTNHSAFTWCNVDTLTLYFTSQDSTQNPWPSGSHPLDTTDTKRKEFMYKMLDRVARVNVISKTYNNPHGLYKSIKIRIDTNLPFQEIAGWGQFNYSDNYPATFWTNSGSTWDKDQPSVITNFGTNWNSKRTIVDMDGETYELNRAIYSVSNNGIAGNPMFSMFNYNSNIFRNQTWDYQQAVDRFIQHIYNMPTGLAGINLGEGIDRTITMGHLGKILKYKTTP